VVLLVYLYGIHPELAARGLHPHISGRTLRGLKAAIAFGALALSLYEARRRLAGKPIPQRIGRRAAGLLAAAAVTAYFWGGGGYAQSYHPWEFFHYFLGSKYHRELGYSRLYACTAVAQSELGPAMEKEVRARKMRNLDTNVLEPAAVALGNPDACTSRFTPQRWEDFKRDVRYFRNSNELEYWNRMQTDHGYNPPPVWTLLGHALASLHAADVPFFKVLAALDLALLVAMFLAVYWAFGWRVLCVALVFWGCQYPASFGWTGSAFLRQDWIFWLVVTACLLKKGWHGAAGATMAYSTLLRVFPGLLLAGPAAVAGWHLWRHRRLASSHRRMAAGGLLATAVLVVVSLATFGEGSYTDFWRHIHVHNSTPLPNHMGLKTIFSHSLDGRMKHDLHFGESLPRGGESSRVIVLAPAPWVVPSRISWPEGRVDPFLKWTETRRRHFAAWKPVYVVAALGVLAATVYVLRRVRSLWISLSLSLGLCVSVAELTNYYYAMFVLAALLARLSRGFERGALLVAGLSQLLVSGPLMIFDDDRYTAQSVLFVLYALACLLSLWPGRTPRKTPERSGAREEGSPVLEAPVRGSVP
jgi:hypothetical protein